VLYNNHISNDTFTKPFVEGGLPGQLDLPRLRRGMSGGAFWSVFWPCPENGTNFSSENYLSCKLLLCPFPSTTLPPTPALLSRL
jgi:membrane dipeptidase